MGRIIPCDDLRGSANLKNNDVGVETVPGMVVAVTYGPETQSVVLVPLAIAEIDPASDTASGTATPGAQVFLYASDSGSIAELRATTSAAGRWKADFAGRFEITETTTIQATIRDANNNGTAFKMHVK